MKGRDIRFRFWLGHTKKMTHPHTLDEVIRIIPEFTVDIISLQFTGLHDKNGKEIYEGDIVRLPNTRYAPKGEERHALWVKNPAEFKPTSDEWIVDVYKVVFKNGCFRCENHNPLSSWDDKLEVIGNIYENPDLA